MDYYLGIDSSTTATKALVMDEEGCVLAVGRSAYGFETPRPLWSEQSPVLWWNATVEAVAEALAVSGISSDKIMGVGLTGQMHGLVMLDGQGEVLRPAILWNDQRTQAECDEIRETIGRQRLLATTGNDALPGFTAPKILWVRNHERALFDRTEHVLLPKDYIRFRLTGEYAIDRSGGSGTLLFDLKQRNWSDDIVEQLGIPTSWLPPTFEGPEITGVITKEAASIVGLRSGTPVFAGAGDQAANAVGVGAVTPGVVGLSIGTSGVVFVATEQPELADGGGLHAFCHAIPGMWHLMGVMLSAAGSYQWFRDAAAPDLSFDELNAAAATASPASSGLLFLPYLSGERTPHPDPLARGAFVGLTTRHGLSHMARSVMEGVAFALRDTLELMTASTHDREVRVSGGGVASELWVRIIADVLNRPVRVVATEEAAAHGAALLAATGNGSFATVAEATTAAVNTGSPFYPSDAVSAYDEAFKIYRHLYPTLRDSFQQLHRFDS